MCSSDLREIEQSITIGIEVNKNPFLLSGEGIDSILPAIANTVLPSPYRDRDLISKKNYLGLFIEQELALSDRLSWEFEGTFDAAISDTSDLSELFVVEPIEDSNFYPELSINYQLSDRLLWFASLEYAAEPIGGSDVNNRQFKSEIYRGFELGIETELNSNWWAIISFSKETQNNITTNDPDHPDFELQINEQTSNSWTGEIIGEINSGWWLYGFYTYTDATVTEDETIRVGDRVEGVANHRAGLWSTYQVSNGLGFGTGIVWNNERPGDAENSFTLPTYLQSDIAIFYSTNNLKAAISIQNLFNTGLEDEEVEEQSYLGTVWLQL